MAGDLEDVVRAVDQRRRERLLEQAERAVALLDADSADPVGRGLLGEALSGLADVPDWVHAARRRHLEPQPPQLPIRTDRLVLRRPTPGDVDALYRWYSQDEVSRYLLTPPVSYDEMAAVVRKRCGEDPGREERDVLSLVVELDGEVVGDLVMFLKGPAYSQAEIGWTLHPAYGGRGIATEAARGLLGLAFGHYGMHRVYAELDARNHPSKALCERLGMRQETHALRDFWSKGEWTDSYRYALLREEYDARR